MAQKSGNDLFHFLKSKTPYCDLVNFLEFIEQITDKIGDENAKKIVSGSKEVLYQMKKDDIMPYVESESSEKENFSKVVLQMQQSFKFVTIGEIQFHKKLISLILRLNQLVSFFRYNEKRQTVTYLIPSILTEGAYSSADKCAERFLFAGILSITIGGYKIYNRMKDPILKKHQSLSLNSSSMNLKLIKVTKLTNMYLFHTYT